MIDNLGALWYIYDIVLENDTKQPHRRRKTLETVSWKLFEGLRLFPS